MAVSNAVYSKGEILAENSNETRQLHQLRVFGTKAQDGRLKLSSLEALYLLEKKKIKIVDGRGKKLTKATVFAKAQRQEQDFAIKYAAFKDLRNRGYVVKTALKFGADFRVYDKGIKPGQDHARWVVFPVAEHKRMTWQDFSAKNRVAHSTKKRLLIAVVDDEGAVSYWESRWIRP